MSLTYSTRPSPEIRGKVIPADYFDETLRLRDEFRAQQTEK